MSQDTIDRRLSRRIKNLEEITSISYLAIEVGKLLFPVGSYYLNETDSTNPATLLGFGTWVAVEAVVPVGYKSGDADFGTAGTTAGANTKTIAQANLPSVSLPVRTASGFNIGVEAGSDTSTLLIGYSAVQADDTTAKLVVPLGGSGTALNVVQASKVVHMWKRTE